MPVMPATAYLDYNATVPLKPAVAEAVAEALKLEGNPSSLHRRGQAARHAVEQARSQVAGLIGARASEIIFTSGGSEANNRSLVLRLALGKVSFLLTGDIEAAAEALLLQSDMPLRSTVLKVPHHASNTSSTPGFVERVDPLVALLKSA